MTQKHDLMIEETNAILNGTAIATPDYEQQHPTTIAPFRLEDEWLKHNPDQCSREKSFYLGALAVLNLMDKDIREKFVPLEDFDPYAFKETYERYIKNLMEFGRELTHECRHFLHKDSKENPV